MFSKIVICVCVIGICQAVLIKHKVGKSDSTNSKDYKTWQLFKVYYSPPYSNYLHDTRNFESYYSYPKYEFEYAVSDKKTGDHKHHQESRDGGRVRGEYSLVEADGSLRKVQYDSDDQKGFNAVISKSVNKHGDHAYSVFGHTQFFPTEHRGELNYFYPTKGHYYSEVINKENSSKPVNELSTEEVTATKSANDDAIEHVEPKIEEMTLKSVELTTVVPQIKEGSALEVAPVVDMIMPNDNSVEGNTENLPENMLSNNTMEETQSKVYTISDSEPASSYYHSRMYYLTY